MLVLTSLVWTFISNIGRVHSLDQLLANTTLTSARTRSLKNTGLQQHVMMTSSQQHVMTASTLKSQLAGQPFKFGVDSKKFNI